MKLNLKFLLPLSLICTQVYAINVLPEIRTTVSVSKADINRISCTNGEINSIDYAADTGLTHKTHENKKNVILLFKQLSGSGRNKIINAKVNILVGCNNEYYPLILDPQEIESQSIFLQTSKLENEARKNNKESNKGFDEGLIDLIKVERNRYEDSEVITNNQIIHLNDLQIKRLSNRNIPGKNYRVNKYVVTSNKDVSLTETQFLNTKLSNYPIIAISIDDFKLNNNKNWTYLYLVVESGGAQ